MRTIKWAYGSFRRTLKRRREILHRPAPPVVNWNVNGNGNDITASFVLRVFVRL